MNAVTFLIREHNLVREMFAKIMEHPNNEDMQLKMFVQLCQDLLRHEKMEQTVWYPILQENEQLAEVIKHLIKEETQAENVIKEIANVDRSEWKQKFFELQKDVEHHAAEEETNLFPKVESILNEEQLDLLGKAMAEFKNQFEKNMK